MLSLVWDIIAFIIEQALKGIVYTALLIMQVVTSEIQALFISDFAVMERYFPVVKDTTNILVIIALTLIFLIFMWQVFRNFGAGVLGDCEDPIPLLIKTVLFTFLIFFSKQICGMFMKITGVINTMFWEIELTWDVDLLLSPGWFQNDWKNWIDGFDGGTATDTLFSQGSVGSAMKDTLAADIWPIVIEAIIVIAICWNFLKLVLEIGERYVVMCILYIFSPVAFATGASNSTSSIFRGWCRMFASSLFMMMLNTWSLLLAMSSIQTFVAKGSVAGANFDYDKLSPSGEIVHAGTVTGTTLVWAIITLAFLKSAQALDEHLNSMGLSTARTGRSLLDDALMVTRTITQGFNQIRNMSNLGKLARGGAAGGAAAGVAAARGGNNTSQSIRMNNALTGSKPTQDQMKTFNNAKSVATQKAGLSDKNIAGTNFNSKDAQGRPTGIAPDGSTLTKLGGGAVMSEMKDGTRAIKSGDGNLSVVWGSGSNQEGLREEFSGNSFKQSNANGTRTTEIGANGARVTTDNDAKTVTTVSPDQKVRTDFMEGSEQRASGIASQEFDPLTQTMTFTDVNGNTSTSMACQSNGPDSEMNAAAVQNAQSSAQSSFDSYANVPEQDKRAAAIDSYKQSDMHAYGLDSDSLSQAQFSAPDENGVSTATLGAHTYTKDADGNITSEHGGYSATYSPSDGNLRVSEPSGKTYDYDSDGGLTVTDSSGDSKYFDPKSGSVYTPPSSDGGVTAEAPASFDATPSNDKFDSNNVNESSPSFGEASFNNEHSQPAVVFAAVDTSSDASSNYEASDISNVQNSGFTQGDADAPAFVAPNDAQMQSFNTNMASDIAAAQAAGLIVQPDGTIDYGDGRYTSFDSASGTRIDTDENANTITTTSASGAKRIDNFDDGTETYIGTPESGVSKRVYNSVSGEFDGDSISEISYNAHTGECITKVGDNVYTTSIDKHLEPDEAFSYVKSNIHSMENVNVNTSYDSASYVEKPMTTVDAQMTPTNHPVSTNESPVSSVSYSNDGSGSSEQASAQYTGNSRREISAWNRRTKKNRKNR